MPQEPAVIYSIPTVKGAFLTCVFFYNPGRKWKHENTVFWLQDYIALKDTWW